MACGAKGTCEQAYRKPGRNTVHCKIQTERGGKWDFCAHQFFCPSKGRYELSEGANTCALRQPVPETKKTGKKEEPKKREVKNPTEAKTKKAVSKDDA